MEETMAFDRVHHLLRVPVLLPDGSAGRFIIDTGVGVSLVAPSVAERIRLVLTGDTFSGRRMSGQEVTAPLAELPRLTLGSLVVRDVVAGILELGPTEGEEGFDGILGLDVLGQCTVTVDPFQGVVHLRDETEPSPGAIAVPVRVERDGISVTLFTDLELPSGRVAHVEVDNGSGCLILDSRFMGDCGVQDGQDGQDGMDTVTGLDKTGHSYTRRFVETTGAVKFAGYPGTSQPQPRTMFQDIVHDGLIGAQFLDRFIYTVDAGNQRLVLALSDHDTGTAAVDIRA